MLLADWLHHSLIAAGRPEKDVPVGVELDCRMLSIAGSHACGAQHCGWHPVHISAACGTGAGGSSSGGAGAVAELAQSLRNQWPDLCRKGLREGGEVAILCFCDDGHRRSVAACRPRVAAI